MEVSDKYHVDRGEEPVYGTDESNRSGDRPSINDCPSTAERSGERRVTRTPIRMRQVIYR